MPRGGSSRSGVPLDAPAPETWRPGRDCPVSPWCPQIPRPLRYHSVCPSGADEGDRDRERARKPPCMKQEGVEPHPWDFLFRGSSFLSQLSVSLSFSLSLCLSPCLPYCQHLFCVVSGPLTPLGEDVGPGELPQPHQILPLRFQPLLLRELPHGSPARAQPLPLTLPSSSPVAHRRICLSSGPGQPDLLLRHLDSHRQDQLRVLCG